MQRRRSLLAGLAALSVAGCATVPVSTGTAPVAAAPAVRATDPVAGATPPKPEANPSAAEAGAPTNNAERTVVDAPTRAAVLALCTEIGALYKRQAWGKPDPCVEFNFSIFGWSEQKRPLLSFEAGDPRSAKLTLLQCGIHGDELPTLPMCLRLINEIVEKKRTIPPGTRIVVQPLLNPDGMLAARPTRTNGNGVDINRNFPTQDWTAKAIVAWKAKEKSTERKFPGDEAHSQSETRAITGFVEKQKPQKIISIHTPLGFLDLDAQGGADKKRRAKFLAINMSKNSGNYTFKTFGFYPGSLGNYAGQERQIPVYTLELPPGGNRSTVDSYWKKFRLALWRAIDFDLDTGQFQED